VPFVAIVFIDNRGPNIHFGYRGLIWDTRPVVW
jgi:hypothetical protein